MLILILIVGNNLKILKFVLIPTNLVCFKNSLAALQCSSPLLALLLPLTHNQLREFHLSAEAGKMAAE